MDLESIARLVGGIGLFLLGMRLMTDGLKYAAGSSLRSILVRSTRTRLRGVASGMLVTALVQSSSAVTVASIGFVNGGMLSLAQALAVTYGSNVGTTMTGWWVAAVGLRIHVAALALPLIGVGMLLRLASRSTRLASLGEAIAGFGVFFLGIDVLRVAFEGLGNGLSFGALVDAGPLRALAYVGAGFLLTVVMQSSSAAIALVLTAAQGGVIPLGAGAALVIGTNIGTTSTAVLAAIGATPNARRVAAGHVVFNLITGIVALLLLPLLLLLIVRGREMLALDTAPAAVLAGFHTIFNLLGVAILWPLTDPLVGFLERRFRTTDEEEARPRYLDRNVLASPHLALNALVMELSRAGQIARRLALAALDAAPGLDGAIPQARRSLAGLVEAIGEFSQRLQRAGIPADLDAMLPTTLLVSRYYSEVAELAEVIAAGRPALAALRDPSLAAQTAGFSAAVRSLVDRAGIERADYDVEAVGRALAEIEDRYHVQKAALLTAGARGAVEVRGLVEVLDWLSLVRRLAEQVERGARFLASLRTFEQREEAAARAADDAAPGAPAPGPHP